MANFNLRLDDELYEEIKRLAAAEQRSVNGQILYWLTWIVKNQLSFVRALLETLPLEDDRLISVC